MSKAKVFYIKEITPENVIKLYDALNVNLKGNIAVKIHSGEAGNTNFIRPIFWKPIIDKIGGTCVECNTAYEGARHNKEVHLKLLEQHEWTKYFKCDIMDENPEEDIEIEIPDGFKIKKNYLGKHIKNYNSMLVLSHFKGHPSGGYGGALKQLSIGCASTAGKCIIHSGGVTNLMSKVWKNRAAVDDFVDSMADAAKTVVDMFKGNLAFINVMKNISIDCDCCSKAALPEIPDMGMFASIDPVAVDQACLDKLMSYEGKGKEAFLKRLNERHGVRLPEMSEKHGLGIRNYEIINLD